MHFRCIILGRSSTSLGYVSLFAFQTFLIIATVQSDTTTLRDGSLANYRPVAIDESWRLVGASGASGSDSVLQTTSKDISFEGPVETKSLKTGMDDFSLSREIDETKIDRTIQDGPLAVKLEDVAGWTKETSGSKLFRMPTAEEQFRSRVISAENKDPPTFVTSKIAYPTSESTGSDRVLARYRVIVPIFLPALKRKILNPTRRPTKYITETITEMVPVKQIVPHVKEVVRAEPVPQSLITDFVRVDGRKLPEKVDDRVQPNEAIVKKVIQNID